jgi:hypothetical protein
MSERIYLEQTNNVMNPKPDGRRSDRHAKKIWPTGTRWILDPSGWISGGHVYAEGHVAELIKANSKMVQPGFGVLVDRFNYMAVIGKLIDIGKITVADLQEVLHPSEDPTEEDPTEGEQEIDEVSTAAAKARICLSQLALPRSAR